MGTRDVRFLVPWRPDGGPRDELWAFCRAWWAERCPDIEIVQGSSPEGPFNRAAAINDAAQGPWDIGIILDADVVAAPDQVYRAADIATHSGYLTLAFERYIGLNKPMTRRVLKGYHGRWEMGYRFRSAAHESSIVAVRRDLWDEIGGLDTRFVGWGQDDVSFAHAARVLRGQIVRVPGLVFHLYHERSSERYPWGKQFMANQELGLRYRGITDPDDMRELLDEAARHREDQMSQNDPQREETERTDERTDRETVTQRPDGTTIEREREQRTDRTETRPDEDQEFEAR